MWSHNLELWRHHQYGQNGKTTIFLIIIITQEVLLMVECLTFDGYVHLLLMTSSYSLMTSFIHYCVFEGVKTCFNYLVGRKFFLGLSVSERAIPRWKENYKNFHFSENFKFINVLFPILHKTEGFFKTHLGWIYNATSEKTRHDRNLHYISLGRIWPELCRRIVFG